MSGTIQNEPQLRTSTKRKQPETTTESKDDEEIGRMISENAKERKLNHTGTVVAGSSSTCMDTDPTNHDPVTTDAISTTETASTGCLVNHVKWSTFVNTSTAAADGESCSSCEADSWMNEFRVRNDEACPEKFLPYVLREYFHSSPMSAMGLQPYFTIPTINVIFSYLWTGPAVFGSRGFKFMHHWDPNEYYMPFHRYFPYELDRVDAIGYEWDRDNDKRPIKVPVYHSLEMIGHRHRDNPMRDWSESDDELDYPWRINACSWSHFKNKSTDEIRLEDYHQMAVEDAPPPEFADQKHSTEFFGQWSRVWRFDDWTSSIEREYMKIWGNYGTRLTMDDSLRPYHLDAMYRRRACRQHQVNDYRRLEAEVKNPGSPLSRLNQTQLSTEEYAARCAQLEAIHATEKELSIVYENTLVLFNLSIVHKLRTDYNKFTARSLGRTRQHFPYLTAEEMNKMHEESALDPCLETQFHACSRERLTYSLHMNVKITYGQLFTRTLYIGWSTLGTHLEAKSIGPFWETDFLDLPSINPAASALVKVQIQCEVHPPDRVTQCVIITRLNHPSSEIYRKTLPDIRCEEMSDRTFYHYSDIPGPLITCQLQEIGGSFDWSGASSFSLTSEVTRTVRQFMVTWLVDGVEVNQHPLSVDCDTIESKSAFMDEVCKPILFSSLGVEYELRQQLGPNPYWRPGYFPINFDQAKLLPPPPVPHLPYVDLSVCPTRFGDSSSLYEVKDEDRIIRR